MNNIVLFGDSITAGVINGYPSPIFSRMISKAVTPYEVINRGIPGDSTRPALSRVQDDVIVSRPKAVVIFFGTNDCKDEQTDIPQFKQNLSQMIAEIGTEKCILITPGITGPSRQEKRPLDKMKQYAQAVIEVGQKNQVPVLDWYGIASHYQPKKLLQSDDIHYTKFAYELLAKNLIPLIKQKLNL